MEDIVDDRVKLTDTETAPLPERSEEFINAFKNLTKSEELFATVKAAYGWRGITAWKIADNAK